MNGWIKLYRSLLDHWVIDDPDKLLLWVVLLLKANHKNERVNIGYEVVELSPGQLIFGTKRFAELTGIHRTKVWRTMQLFEDDGMVEYDTETYDHFSVVTINNWDERQDIETRSGQSGQGVEPDRETRDKHEANTRQTRGKTNKNVKNDKNDEEVLNTSRPPSESADPKFAEDDPPFKAAKYIRKRIKDHNPRTAVPDPSPEDSTFENWCLAMDRLHRLGPIGGDTGYRWQEIRRLIDWTFDDEFWSGQVMSATGFRDKIVKIENQMKRDEDYEEDDDGRDSPYRDIERRMS